MDHYDIVAIGAALLDHTVAVDETFLETHKLIKGTMSLVDQETFTDLIGNLAKATIKSQPGGSIANAVATASLLGAKTALMAKIGGGQQAQTYKELTKESGVTLRANVGTKAQGTCLVLVTPDGERTFATHLGASTEFSESDIDYDLIAQSDYLLLEGYQLDNDPRGLINAAQYAKEHGVKVAVDVSDRFLIQRHREALRELNQHADILFLNEDEYAAYTDKTDIDSAFAALPQPTVIIKLGVKGSLIRHEGTVHTIPGFRVTVANTNGAGDAYAGAFLASLVQGKNVQEAGTIASYIAAQTVATPGPRLAQIDREALYAAIGK